MKSAYEDLSRGDVDSVLVVFDEHAEFRLAEGHPYQPSGRPWFGKAAVLENLIELGDDVVVECRYQGTYKPTGKAFDIQVCHVWTFRNGKACVFHQYIDTARLQDVMGMPWR